MAYHHIFVYGTLKRGLYNTKKMFDPETGVSKFVGMAKTVEKYPFVVATDLNCPLLLDKPGHGKNVIGELYEVDDKKLLFLEKMERLYRQDKIKVLIYETNPDDANMDHYQSKEVECLCYLFDNYKEKLLDLPFDEVYDPNGNPRHELNPQKIPLTEENLKKIRKYLEGEVIEDMDKQIARDDILKAKTSI